MKQSSKYRTQKNLTTATQQAADKEGVKTTKTGKIFYYLFAVVFISTAFFIHEFSEPQTTEFLEAQEIYKAEKKERTRALAVIKKMAEGTPEYEHYLQTRKSTIAAFNAMKVQEDNDKTFGFSNMNQFLGELGWAVGVTTYALLMLFLTYYKNKTSKGEYILHGTLLSIGLFYIYYTFQPFIDYPKSWYIIGAVLSSLLIILSIHFLLKEKQRYIQKLLQNIRTLVGFVLNNTKKESENEMWNELEKVSKNE